MNLPTKYQAFSMPSNLATARKLTPYDYALADYLADAGKGIEFDKDYYYELVPNYTNSNGMTFNVFFHADYYTSSNRVHALRSLDQLSVYKLCRSVGILA